MPLSNLVNKIFGITQIEDKFNLDFKVAPIIDSPPERGFDNDYRRSSDPEHVIRVNQRPPKGFPKKVKEYVKVAGISQPDTTKNAIAFICGSQRSVNMKKEPDNPIDPKAIKINGSWKANNKNFSGKLGYLPAEITEELMKADSEFAYGVTLDAMFIPHEIKGVGVRISIWAPRAKKKEVKDKPFDATIKVPDDPVERNLFGKELEDEGLIFNAIACYQANVNERFDGSFPYERLAIIFRKQKEYSKEIEVLNVAISVFEKDVNEQRSDRDSKLSRFRERRDKAVLLSKTG